VQLSIPILNRAARADVTGDELQVQQQEIRLRQLEKQAKLEIRTAQIAVDEARASGRTAFYRTRRWTPRSRSPGVCRKETTTLARDVFRSE
jgi:hypothetical protein